MFVSVFLIDAKAHTVVPKQFILGLIEVNLLNSGVNQNQNRLVYFSNELFDLLMNRENPNFLEFIPNFDLEVTTAYPLPDNLRATCFRGRLMKFFETFDDAFYHAYRLRPYLPALFNPARQFELPIPPMQNNFQSNNQLQVVDETAHQQTVANEQQNESNTSQNNAGNFRLNDELQVNDEPVNEQIVNDEQQNNTNASESDVTSEEIDIKPFSEIQLENSDICAFDAIFNEQTIDNDVNTYNDALASDENVTSGSSDVCSTTETLNDSLEITYESKHDFRPKTDDGFIVKANDAFSSNWPFMQNVIHFYIKFKSN